MNPARRGYTLIEVLVALGLGLVLAAALQRFLVGAYRISRDLEADQRTAARAALPFELLAADLRNLPPGGDFALDADGLRFVTLNALDTGCTAARHAVRVRYSWAQAADARVRLRRAEQELTAVTAPGPGVLLTEPADRVVAEIFDGQHWQTRWPLPLPRRPQALRMTLTTTAARPYSRTVRLAPFEWTSHAD